MLTLATHHVAIGQGHTCTTHQSSVVCHLFATHVVQRVTLYMCSLHVPKTPIFLSHCPYKHYIN